MKIGLPEDGVGQKPSNSRAAGAASKQLQLSAGEKRSEKSGVIVERGESKKRKMN